MNIKGRGTECCGAAKTAVGKPKQRAPPFFSLVGRTHTPFFSCGETPHPLFFCGETLRIPFSFAGRPLTPFSFAGRPRTPFEWALPTQSDGKTQKIALADPPLPWTSPETHPERRLDEGGNRYIQIPYIQILGPGPKIGQVIWQ